MKPYLVHIGIGAVIKCRYYDYRYLITWAEPYHFCTYRIFKGRRTLNQNNLLHEYLLIVTATKKWQNVNLSCYVGKRDLTVINYNRNDRKYFNNINSLIGTRCILGIYIARSTNINNNLIIVFCISYKPWVNNYPPNLLILMDNRNSTVRFEFCTDLSDITPIKIKHKKPYMLVQLIWNITMISYTVWFFYTLP